MAKEDKRASQEGVYSGTDPGREYTGEFGETINAPVGGARPSGSEAIPRLDAAELKSMLDEVLVLDLRGGPGAQLGRVPEGRIQGAVVVDPANLAWVAGLAQEQAYVLYCDCPDEEAAEVAARLASQGFANVSVLKGGWRGWREAGFPVEGED